MKSLKVELLKLPNYYYALELYSCLASSKTVIINIVVVCVGYACSEGRQRSVGVLIQWQMKVSFSGLLS